MAYDGIESVQYAIHPIEWDKQLRILHNSVRFYREHNGKYYDNPNSVLDRVEFEYEYMEEVGEWEVHHLDTGPKKVR